MKNKPTAGITAIVLGGLTALIPLVIFPVCSNMLELTNGKMLSMKCHWTKMAELVIGILIVFDGILLVYFKKVKLVQRLALCWLFWVRMHCLYQQ